MADRQEEVARAVAVVDPLDRPALRPADLVEVRLLEDGLPRRVVDVVLVGRPAGPVAVRREHLADEQPVGREARHHDVVDLAGGVAGAADLDLDVVRTHDDRLGRDARPAGARAPGRPPRPPAARAVAGRRSASSSRPGCRRSRACPRRPTAGPAGAAAGPRSSVELHAAAGDRHDGRFLLRMVEDDRLAVGRGRRHGTRGSASPSEPDRSRRPVGVRVDVEHCSVGGASAAWPDG